MKRNPGDAIFGLLYKLVAVLPIIIPVYFIGDELIKNGQTHPITQFFAGAQVPAEIVLTAMLDYLPYFIPAAVLFLIFYLGGEDEKLRHVDASRIKSREESKSIMSVSWKPQGILASPYNNKNWLEIKPGVFVFQSTHNYRFYSYPLIFIGLIYMALMYIGFMNSEAEFTPRVFLNMGTALVVGGIVLNVVLFVSSIAGFAIKESTKEVALDGELKKFSDVKALQIVAKEHAQTAGDAKVWTAYEVNVVHGNNDRTTILNHGGLEMIVVQIGIVNEYLSVPVYADDKTLENIAEHNEEYKLQEA